MDNIKISIIVVVYNSRDALRLTLRSIIEQRYSNKEIIVIDGNSTDGTKDVIIENSLDISMWVSEPDSGIYDAMNKGLMMATGDYVWYVNAGDFIYNEYTLENIFRGDDLDSDIYYGDTLIVNEKSEVLGLRKKRVPNALVWQDFRKGMVICHQSIIIKKEIVEKFDTTYKYSADYKWVIEAVKKSKSRKNTKEIISIFSNGGATTQHRKESLNERYAIMKEFFGTFQTILSHIRFVGGLLAPKYRKYKKTIE